MRRPRAVNPRPEGRGSSRYPVDRRSFLLSVAATGGGLALGFNVPSGERGVRAAVNAREITAWVVIEPDDTVIVRIARSEMGQGSFTGLSMLVAEELECDWSKVRAAGWDKKVNVYKGTSPLHQPHTATD